MKGLFWSFHPGGAYYSAWDHCSCALLQLDNDDRHYFIVSGIIMKNTRFSGSKVTDDGFILQGIRSNSVLTVKKRTLKLCQD